MKAKINNQISSKGLNYKLKVAFALMSVLPLLVSMYLVSHYILPRVGLKIDIAASIVISIFIAVIGFFVVKEVFDRFVSITNGAKMIAAGDYHRSLENVSQDDEVGDLGNALNRLTQRIRSNMNEIKEYSEKTAEINLGIQKRVIVLSSILQISSLISEGNKLDDILKDIVEKSKLLASSDLAYLLFREENQAAFYMRWADGLNFQKVLDVKVEPNDEVFYKINEIKKALILDKTNLASSDFSSFIHEKINLHNTVALPILSRNRTIGFLGIGNNKEGFVYAKEDIELLDVFVKQLTIAVENDQLSHNVKKLEIKDSLTGLYNQSFMHGRLQEIKRAIMYQRPCALIHLDIDNFKPYSQVFGSLSTEAVIKKVANLIRDPVREIDRVGRIGDDEFAVILPEKNKRQAQEIAEDIRKKIQFAYGEESDQAKKITISAGVSENPLDGISADELIIKAKELLKLAKSRAVIA